MPPEPVSIDRRPSVGVVGSINMDLVVRAPRLPARGETILGGPFATHPGGKGANQAVAAARLGARVAFLARVGDDAYGSELRDVLRERGVDPARVLATGGAATGVGVITVDADGENTIVVAPGANHRLAPADVEAARDVAADVDVLLLQLEIPFESVERAAELARASGVTVVLNAAPAAEVSDDLLRLVDVLVVNEEEGRRLAGRCPTAEREALLERLASRGPGRIVLTRGARGSTTFERGSCCDHPAFAVRAVDTVAAGDAFCGGLAVALAGGASLAAAAAFASAAGALAATREGAMPSLPTRAEVDALLARAPAVAPR